MPLRVTRPVARLAPTRPSGEGERGGGRPHRRKRWFLRIVGGLLLVAVSVLAFTAFRVWQVARLDDRRPVDVVIVLGAAQYDGSPSPIFAARLRHAQQLYNQGIATHIMTVGGRKAGDGFTEADAGRRYLLQRGVPADVVTAIGAGSSTLESLRPAVADATRKGWRTSLLVSDPWHSLRARTMARDFGLEAWTSPTRSGPVVQTRETQIRYIVRETGALLYYWLTNSSLENEGYGLG